MMYTTIVYFQADNVKDYPPHNIFTIYETGVKRMILIWLNETMKFIFLENRIRMNTLNPILL